MMHFFRRPMVFAAYIAVVAGFGLSAHAADTRAYAGELLPVIGDYVVVVGDQRLSLGDLEKDLMLYQAEMATNWGVEGTFVGPKLLDVLSHAGLCACAPLTLRAADDYSVTLPAWPEGIEEAMIATRLNGDAFPLDEFGPFWIVWPSMNDAVVAGNEDHAAYWIWSVVEIGQAE